jgi:ABC-2 type transport system permease protein
MNRLIAAELLKLRKRGMTWILLYILVGIVIVLHLLLFAISRITLPNAGPNEMANLQDLLGMPEIGRASCRERVYMPV